MAPIDVTKHLPQDEPEPWQPREITGGNWHDIYDQLAAKANELVTEEYKKTEKYVGPSKFFSGSEYPCVYHKETVPSNFNFLKISSDLATWHFMPYRCDCQERAVMESDTEVICLAIDWRYESGEPYRYFLHGHKIGQCPFKRPLAKLVTEEGLV